MGRKLASAKAMTEAAEAFLPALSPELRASAAFDFDSNERHTWHYIPKVRGGVMRGRMDTGQLEAADRLMAAGLSQMPASRRRRRSSPTRESWTGSRR